MFIEHKFFLLFDMSTKVTTNCMLPTRVFQDILLLSPNVLKKMERQKSMVLDITDYSVLEKSASRNAVKFLKQVMRLNYKPFRLSKVS